jgi:hypothetical protein
MIEDINLIANYCHVDWLDRRVGKDVHMSIPLLKFGNWRVNSMNIPND